MKKVITELNTNPFYDEDYYKEDFSWARASKVEKIKAVMEQMKETQIEENGGRWENEGGLPADDSNFDNHVPTVAELEENVKSAVRKRNNVVRLRECGLEDDDWYFGC